MSEMVDMRALLEVAKCPCCDGSGGRYDNYGNVEQCQWCYERSVAIAAPAPVAQAEQEPVAQKILDLILDECKYWHYRDEARRGGFAALYAKAKEVADAAPPAQPDASALVEALATSLDECIKEWDGELDSKLCIDFIGRAREALAAYRAAMAAKEGK